jgi:hypothetical protein
MQLSADGKKLLSVTNNDLENGVFKFPETVTHIGYRAFRDCTDLRQVTIPDSVTHIGEWAFDNCYNLTQITIPNSVTHIGNCAFSHCYGLTHVTISSSVTHIHWGTFFGCRRLTHVTIPDSVTHIFACAFWRCSLLTRVTIPDSVSYIGREAFRACTRLTHVTIPNSVTHIDQDAFVYCCNLQVIAIDNSNAEDYQRVLNVLPRALHAWVRGCNFKDAQVIKQNALKSVAALSTNGLTAHLLFKLLTQDGKISGNHRYPVSTKSFFQRLNHARQPALGLTLTLEPNSDRLFPEYAQQMLPLLCFRIAVRLNPAVTQIPLPTSKQEQESFFRCVTTTALLHVRISPNPPQRKKAPKASSAQEIKTISTPDRPYRSFCALM